MVVCAGSKEFCFSADQKTSVLFTVEIALPANRMEKIVMTKIETIPPDIVLYSSSWLYRRNCVIEKRSKILKN